MAWTTIISLLFGLWLLSNFYYLTRNYLLARKIGAPIFILPWNNYNPIWMILSVPLRPYLEKYLPTSWYAVVNRAIYGFEFRSKEALFPTNGDAFILVTSGPVELSIRDPELASEVLKRIKDFPNTDIGGFIMNIFGPSLLTSDGEDWTRQRKLIAPNINEKISSLVFGESISQARQMLTSWMDDLKGVTDNTMSGMKTVAINVLGTAGFGISQPWKKGKGDQPDPGYRHTYMEATRTVVENIIESAVMPAKLLTLPLFSPSWQAIGHAKNEFPIHTKKMLENERQLQSSTTETRSNLMSLLVKLADAGVNDDDAQRAKDEKSSSKATLTLKEEELLGNLFIFTSAGFDTTANTMAYALAMLATYPEWQEWLYEEIAAVLADMDFNNLEYNEVYPRLPRCLALLYETLRLFPPLTHLAKQTNKTHDVTITTSKGKTYHIPRGTIIYVNTVALGLDSRTWGPDSHTFRPSRWLVDSSAAPGTTSVTNIKTPPRGTFLPWSSGPRACPGMKMSQVEFVSVFMTIFGMYRCEPVKHDGETDEEVKSRCEAIMQDSQPKLTLQMMRNQDLKVTWVKR